MKQLENNWREIAYRVGTQGDSFLWDYLTALRSQDTAQRFDAMYLKMLLTDPVRGFCVDAADIMSTYGLLEEMRGERDLIAIVNSLRVELEQVSPHYIQHMRAGWSMIGEMGVLHAVDDVCNFNEPCTDEYVKLICEVNKFVRKICVHDGVIA